MEIKVLPILCLLTHLYLLRAWESGNAMLIRDGTWCRSWHRVGAPWGSSFNEQVPSLPQSGEPQEREEIGIEDSGLEIMLGPFRWYHALSQPVGQHGVHILPMRKRAQRSRVHYPDSQSWLPAKLRTSPSGLWLQGHALARDHFLLLGATACHHDHQHCWLTQSYRAIGDGGGPVGEISRSLKTPLLIQTLKAFVVPKICVARVH